MFWTYLGYVAAICTTISFLPQAIKIFKSKETKGISLIMYSLFVVGVLLWTAYGVHIQDIALILANSITSVLAAVVLGFKIVNVRKGEEI